jgi:tRNA pseudouridine38-40 synthase
MPNYRLELEYEGTRFDGWQEQPQGRTVIGVLKKVFREIDIPLTELVGAGRTDRGVHALQQIAHLRTSTPLTELTRLHRVINDQLPADINLRTIALASDSFHARHDAKLRSYLYQIVTRRTVFLRRHSWWVKHPLDLPRMDRSLKPLRGRHDFEPFTDKRIDPATSTLVEMGTPSLNRHGDVILLRLTASHFLWKMVRRIVGVMVKIGTGEVPVETFKTLLSGNPPAGWRSSIAEWTAPPAGLFLERVIYEGDEPVGKPEPRLAGRVAG